MLTHSGPTHSLAPPWLKVSLKSSETPTKLRRHAVELSKSLRWAIRHHNLCWSYFLENSRETLPTPCYPMIRPYLPGRLKDGTDFDGHGSKYCAFIIFIMTESKHAFSFLLKKRWLVCALQMSGDHSLTITKTDNNPNILSAIHMIECLCLLIYLLSRWMIFAEFQLYSSRKLRCREAIEIW